MLVSVYLFFDYLPNLLIRHRREIVVIYSDIILSGIEVLKAIGIYSGVVLAGVDVTKELPDVIFVHSAAPPRQKSPR